MKNNDPVRLSKYLADCGVWSRRKCKEIIIAGKIKVNDITVKEPSFKIIPGDRVFYGKSAVIPRERIVIALNKPKGYLSTVRDEHKRRTIMDLIDIKNARIYPAGRLDKDSRGLIILTNDGNLAYFITHPGHNITKTYEVTVDGPVDEAALSRIKKGILIDNRVFLPESVRVLKNGKKYCILLMEIHEGRKRIIRRVFDKLGYRVKDLKRVRIGRLSLHKLNEGNYKVLNRYEIAKLTEKTREK
ncbi:MAG: rRNA pseudouridine synthase [Actinobacteria bacterium]|nr:rRNA pseudouridine synthase [Actinomycetota bacterium]